MHRGPARATASSVATVLTVLIALTAAACSGDDETANSSSQPTTSAGSSRPPPIDRISNLTGPPPAQLEELGAVVLLGAEEVGVPATWAIRDLDPFILDPVLNAAADPFQGLVTCPDGAVRGDDAWLQRTFRAPEQPLDNGLLSVDLIAESEDEDAAEAGRAALAACTAVGLETSVDVLDVQIAVAGDDSSGATISPIRGTEIVVAAGPSADVPYPSVAVAVTAWRNGRSVTVVAAGLDTGVPFAAVAEDLVGRLLARAD